MNSCARSLLLGLVGVVSFSGFGQTPSTEPPAQAQGASSSTGKVEMPSDPAALLELAAKKNGLRNVRSAPWHLKATYEVLDESGKTKDSGTFEVFWVSARSSRESYASTHFNQVSITNEKGFYKEGDPGSPQGAG
jgi:hypothetical protein